MKKSLFAVLSILPLMLCSCGGDTAKGVMGKTFTYSSLTSETVKSGTKEEFYTENNLAGATSDAVVSRLVKAIYDGDCSSSSTFSALEFTTHPGASNVTYNGNSITCYEYNYATIGEYGATNAGYYIDLGNDWTSLHFLTLKTSGVYEDMVYSLGGEAGSQTGKGSYSYKTTAKDTAIKYDAANKALSITMDVTFVCTENETTVTSAMTYVLNFQEK